MKRLFLQIALLSWILCLFGCATSLPTSAPTIEPTKIIPSPTQVALIPTATETALSLSDTATATVTPSRTNTLTPSATPTSSLTPTFTPTITPSPTAATPATNRPAPLRTPLSTPVPQFKIVDGKIDECALYTKTEIEVALGASLGDPKPVAGVDPAVPNQPLPGCYYTSQERMTLPNGTTRPKEVEISLFHLANSNGSPNSNPPQSTADIVAASSWFWIADGQLGHLGTGKNGIVMGILITGDNEQAAHDAARQLALIGIERLP